MTSHRNRAASASLGRQDDNSFHHSLHYDYTCLGSAVRMCLIRTVHVVKWAYEYQNANDENQYHNPSFGSEW
ncbi:hypothetical protein BBBOND_0101620 [Babesia bigemina]|uniref:Uncharacterized protein n=1 Tax=Babesia bigemina TaxID=5866 RepID=A0A061CZL3_BABBI|nr:hypothetical protein BBBOND_0101620 [Babesia bigemina]CDR93833.1 hypothetical protein BBBOND_0101620 [Babesia bigemina]|eukprot:XP_012766019.1 hypothetical protein BBBOND_0101620 [Babesia bigemina]